jgi:hypothetical protein
MTAVSSQAGNGMQQMLQCTDNEAPAAHSSRSSRIIAEQAFGIGAAQTFNNTIVK